MTAPPPRTPGTAAMTTLEPLVTAKEAARLLAISERKLWQMTNSGDVPAVRIGRSVRYDSADLAAWVAEHKTGRARR